MDFDYLFRAGNRNVARTVQQYLCGLMQVEKDNCQVGVFCALGRGDRVSLIDARLYLPPEWTDDPRLCDHAAVPTAYQVHRTKVELALEIVRHARQSGVRFEWIGMNGLYGQSLELLKALQEHGEAFLAEIHSNRHIYLTDPAPYSPAQEGGRPRVCASAGRRAGSAEVCAARMDYVCMFGIPLPLWLAPRSNSYETEQNGRFRFHVEISHPLTGLIA